MQNALAQAIPDKELRTAAPLSQQQCLSVRRRETNLADPSLGKCEQGQRCVTEKIDARGVGRFWDERRMTPRDP